ncbi:Hypothetical protein BJL86_0559 [Dietzia timorensis]|uniref:Uncharacterized protein n=1 Tax=Dietzia timorensis TaxID=499555 RepID=A0A173LKW5_9ACTN|nr:Hypothetical protein BJL86_0559 [Dietzia timorensis]
MSGTINRAWARGRYDHLSTEFYEFDYSNFLNQAMKFAIGYLIDTMEESNNSIQQQMNILVESRTILESVSEAPPYLFLSPLRDHLSTDVSEEPYLSFRPLLNLALLIASGETPDVAGEAEGIQFSLPPLVLDMEKTFEQFCIAIFNKSLNGESFELLDTSGVSNTPLLHPPVESNHFWTPVRATESAHPDFVIQQRDSSWLIGEVKYSLSPSSSHIHQVCAHADAFSCNTVLLIYPSKTTLKSPRLEMLGFLAEKRVFRLWISIDFTSLDKLIESINMTALALLNSEDYSNKKGVANASQI